MAKTKEAPAPKAKKATAAKSMPTHDEIATRAYQIYLERCATPGDPMQDWLRAERELAAPPKKSGVKSKVITFAA
jgi:hypothetical protein